MLIDSIALLPSWANAALRSGAFQKKSPRSDVDRLDFLVRGLHIGILGKHKDLMLNARCCLHAPLEKLAQLLLGQIKLE